MRAELRWSACRSARLALLQDLVLIAASAALLGKARP